MSKNSGRQDSNIIQLEKRAIGATHVQAFIWLDTRRRRTSVSELLGADENPHPETVKTARAIEEYCRKEESREAGPLSNIQEEERKLLSRGSRTEIAEACDLIRKRARKKIVATSYPISFVKYSRGPSQLALEVRNPRKTCQLCYGCVARQAVANPTVPDKYKDELKLMVGAVSHRQDQQNGLMDIPETSC